MAQGFTGYSSNPSDMQSGGPPTIVDSQPSNMAGYSQSYQSTNPNMMTGGGLTAPPGPPQQSTGQQQQQQYMSQAMVAQRNMQQQQTSR